MLRCWYIANNISTCRMTIYSYTSFSCTKSIMFIIEMDAITKKWCQVLAQLLLIVYFEYVTGSSAIQLRLEVEDCEASRWISMLNDVDIQQTMHATTAREADKSVGEHAWHVKSGSEPSPPCHAPSPFSLSSRSINYAHRSLTCCRVHAVKRWSASRRYNNPTVASLYGIAVGRVETQAAGSKNFLSVHCGSVVIGNVANRYECAIGSMISSPDQTIDLRDTEIDNSLAVLARWDYCKQCIDALYYAPNKTSIVVVRRPSFIGMVCVWNTYMLRYVQPVFIVFSWPTHIAMARRSERTVRSRSTYI